MSSFRIDAALPCQACSVPLCADGALRSGCSRMAPWLLMITTMKLGCASVLWPMEWFGKGWRLPFFVVELSEHERHVGMPPFPVCGVEDELLAGDRLGKGPILIMLVGASASLDRGRTKSKAAIFFLGAGTASFDAGVVPGGTYLPTMREVGVSSSTALSDQVIGSGGF